MGIEPTNPTNPDWESRVSNSKDLSHKASTWHYTGESIHILLRIQNRVGYYLNIQSSFPPNVLLPNICTEWEQIIVFFIIFLCFCCQVCTSIEKKLWHQQLFWWEYLWKNFKSLFKKHTTLLKRVKEAVQKY